MRHEKAEQLISLGRALAASAEGLTLDEIAAEMGVSRRTADRLRDACQRLFPQLEGIADGATKRFRITGGIDSFFQCPTTEELLALNKAAKDFERRKLGEDAQALNALDKKVRAAMRRLVLNRMEPDLEALLRAELIAVQAGPRPVDDENLLRTLRTSLLSMKALRFVYRRGSRPGSIREVVPYGIIFGRMNYLVAPELGQPGKIKTWRLDQLQNAEILERSASRPEDFSLVDYANASFGFYQSKQEDVVLRVLKEGADDLMNWRFHPTQTLEPQADGSMIVRFRASGILELAWHLFTWQNKIQIIAPADLRETMVNELAKALTFHQSPPRNL